MPKAIIFDLNGVFIQSPKLSDRFRDELGVPTEKFLPALKEIMDKVRQPGAPPSFTLWQPYLKEWGIGMSEKDFFDFWFSAEKANEEMITLARELKRQGIRLFILSNNFAERAKFYDETFPWLKELFEKVYYSWQTGFIKPDPLCWQTILAENNLQPADTLYLDDSAANVEAAKTLGINAFVFQGAEETKKILNI
jgi:HAD superfamily hydrolase (TIGR01509 family)